MSLPVFDKVRNSIEALDEKTRESLVKEVKGIFEFHIKDCNDTPSIYTLDLKNNQGSVLQGKGSDKADTVITIADQDFVSLAGGKLSGQKAYTLGKLKIKGHMMLATKLDAIFRQLVGKSKL